MILYVKRHYIVFHSKFCTNGKDAASIVQYFIALEVLAPCTGKGSGQNIVWSVTTGYSAHSADGSGQNVQATVFRLARRRWNIPNLCFLVKMLIRQHSTSLFGRIPA